MPFGLTPADIDSMRKRVDAPPGFEVVLSSGRALDAIAEPKLTADRLAGLRDVGATAVTCSVAAASPSHYCDQLAALRVVADELERRRL